MLTPPKIFAIADYLRARAEFSVAAGGPREVHLNSAELETLEQNLLQAASLAAETETRLGLAVQAKQLAEQRADVVNPTSTPRVLWTAHQVM